MNLTEEQKASAVLRLAEIVKAANDIADVYKKSIIDRGRTPTETFTNPGTDKVQENHVFIPVRLLNALVKAMDD